MSDNVIPFLPAALEREVRSALDDAHIYDIDSVGWLNARDPDPNFIGYAMWAEYSTSIDYEALSGEQPVRHRPDEIEEAILTTGEDFTGIMQAFRLSIGLALLWHRQARQDFFGDSAFYWLHYTDSFLKLEIASDRLRKLLLWACTRQPPKVYDARDNDPKNKWYVTPFDQAKELLEARGLHDTRLASPAASLPTFGDKIFRFIQRRNKIVHEVATRMAKLQRDLISKQRKRFDREQIDGFRLEDTSTLALAQKAADSEIRAEVEGSLQEITDWYKLLILAGNAVFEIEYWVRKLAP